MENHSLNKINYNKDFLRFLAISIGFGIQGIAWTAIPVLFYRPEIQCEGNYDDNLICNEFLMCQNKQDQNSLNNITFRQYNPYQQVFSISQEFDLYCDRKIMEANLLSLGIFGQVLGALLIFVYKIPSYQQQKYFIYLTGLQSLFFLLVQQLKTIYYVAFILFIWNFIGSIYQCLIYTHIQQTFTGKIQQQGASLTNIIWNSVQICYYILTYFIGNWQQNLSGIVGTSNFIIFLILIVSYNPKVDNELYNLVQIQQKEQKCNISASYINQIIAEFQQNINKLKNNIILYKNCCIWTLNRVTGSVSYYMVTLSLNTMVGNLFANNIGCISLELVAQLLISVFLLKSQTNLKKMIIFMYLILGFSFILTVFINNSKIQNQEENNRENSIFEILFKLLPIIIGITANEGLWTILYTYMPKIIDTEIQQFNSSGSQIITIIACLIMPYYKLVMEFFTFTPFFLLGLLCLFTANKSIQYQELFFQQNKNKNDTENDFEQIELVLLNIEKQRNNSNNLQ